MKKGELSINIIIVAAIALLILVIISVLIFRSGSNIRDNTESCTSVNGVCDTSCDDVAYDRGGVWIPNPSRICPTEGDICCTKV